MPTNDDIDHSKDLFEAHPGTTAHFDGFMSSHSLQHHSPGGIPYPPLQQTRQSPAQQISSLSDAILQKFAPLFSSLQQHTTDQVQKIQAEVLNLSQTVQTANGKSQSDIQEVVKSFEQLRELHMAEVRETRDRIARLEEVVGSVAKSLDLTIIIDRLSSIEHTVENLAQEEHLGPSVAQTDSSPRLEPTMKDAGALTEGSQPPQSKKPDVSRFTEESFCPHYTSFSNSTSTPSLFSKSMTPVAPLIQHRRSRYVSPSRTLSPADWSRAVPNPHSSSRPPFNPAPSDSFRLIQQPRETAPDGTVAALRSHAIGLPYASLLGLPELSSSNQPSAASVAVSHASSHSHSHSHSPAPSIPSPVYPFDNLNQEEEDLLAQRTLTPPNMLLVDMLDDRGSGEGEATPLDSLLEETEVGEALGVPSNRSSPIAYPKERPLSPLSSLSALNSNSDSDLEAGPSIEELVLMAKKPVRATQGSNRKRKAESQTLPEPLSKRHRRKSRKKQNARVARSASKSPRKLSHIWPVIPEEDTVFDRQFIQCDGCKAWYHYGCVGIVVGDTRLESDEPFLCPPCSCRGRCSDHPFKLDLYVLTSSFPIWSDDKGLRKPSDHCIRPDCSYAKQGLDSDEYFVERIVGRKPVGRHQFIWLVKWEGYPISQAEWISVDTMQDHIKLVKQFIDDALTEGVELVSDDTVLLMEARMGGWVS